jgi:thymidylate synthase (FAD)
MLKQCREVCPMLFRNAGPACLRGACPEGAMTCGKAAEIRERSEQLGK